MKIKWPIKSKGQRLGLKAFYRQITSSFRALPNFIVIGTMKGGTSSMYYYLQQHTQVSMAYKGEVHFFDNNFHKGVRWYRSFFPLKYKAKIQAIGEVTPGYIFKDCVLERVKALVPEARFIILLRNPVDRAYSHFQQRERRQLSGLTFEEFITPALSGTAKSDELSSNMLRRGLYGQQIIRWFKHFDRSQFLLIESEEFFADPNTIMKQVHKFLGLKHEPVINLNPRTTGGYTTEMSRETREVLNNYYAKSNNQLAELGLNFSWIKPPSPD